MRSRLAILAILFAGCAETTDGGFEPYMPPPAENPYVDVAYLQEFNHTSNEVEPGIGELIAVLLPPAGLTGFETPTRITPRGLVTVEIDAAEPDLVGAAFYSGGLVLAGPSSLYFYEAGSLTPVAMPAGLEITGLQGGADHVYLLTDQGLGRTEGPAAITRPTAGSPVTAALEHGSDLVVGGADYIAAYQVPGDGAPDWTLDPGVGTVVGLVADVTLPRQLDLVVVGSDGIAGIAAQNLVTVDEFTAGRVPLDQPVAAARASDGGFIVATRGGACRIMERGIGPEWRVYNQERWLPQEDVRGLATDPAVPDGPVYFATAGGLATVTAERMTLEQKLEPFVERVVLRHDRDGAVADSRLSQKGDLSTNIPWDSDNDGGWTCYWILSECFRYQVTGDMEAKAHFDKSLERMLSFQTLTGTDHFLARAVIRKDGCRLDDCDDPDDGEWFSSPDGEWWVKGDTSNDEVTSHMFMMGHAYDLCADEEQRAGIRAHVDAVIGGIVDNGYQLLDIDGEVTTYGQFDPYYVNEGVQGAYGDGGRRSVQILAALNLAHYLTGKQKYLDAKRYLIEEHHYDENVVHESEYEFRKGSGDGDELGTQAFFILLRYEPDPALREKWIEGWRRSYSNMREQQAALWDLVNAVVGGEDPRFELTARWLQLAPADMIRWNQHNSHRLDLAPPPDYYDQAGRIRSDGYIIPYDERPCDRWNTNQYKVDGGHGGLREMDGADVLAPYWMGRYYGFIVAD